MTPIIWKIMHFQQAIKVLMFMVCLKDVMRYVLRITRSMCRYTEMHPK